MKGKIKNKGIIDFNKGIIDFIKDKIDFSIYYSK